MKYIILVLIAIFITMNLYPGALLKVGSDAPDFTLKSETGELIVLSKILEQSKVVLIFYPGDNTPVCTTQLCAVRDDWDEFKKSNIMVFGVNPGGAESHNKFSDKYQFPFPLLIDSDRSVAKKYKTKGGIFVSRSVYGITKDGKIIFVQSGKPDNETILQAFK